MCGLFGRSDCHRALGSGLRPALPRTRIPRASPVRHSPGGLAGLMRWRREPGTSGFRYLGFDSKFLNPETYNPKPYTQSSSACGRYDTIALGAEEARHPRDVPVGMLVGLAIVMVIYLLMVSRRKALNPKTRIRHLHGNLPAHAEPTQGPKPLQCIVHACLRYVSDDRHSRKPWVATCESRKPSHAQEPVHGGYRVYYYTTTATTTSTVIPYYTLHHENPSAHENLSTAASLRKASVSLACGCQPAGRENDAAPPVCATGFQDAILSPNPAVYSAAVLGAGMDPPAVDRTLRCTLQPMHLGL